MARRKKGNPVNAWLILDKPDGMTSNQALSAVKRLLNPQKAGHAGTLDPLATGVLPIALGEATKTVPFAVDGQKAYRFTVRWGVETTTDDSEGAVARTSATAPSRADVEALLAKFTGEILQVPPQFSAIKVDGDRAYDLARGGVEVVLEARLVTITSLTIAEMPGADTCTFDALCGKGTYVRAIARDMGRLLGCYGHVTALRRTRVGGFGEDDAIGLDALSQAVESGTDLVAANVLRPVQAALDKVPAMSVSASDASDLHQGRSVLIRGRDAPIHGGFMYATCRGRIVALGEVAQGALHPTRVFNLGAVSR